MKYIASSWLAISILIFMLLMPVESTASKDYLIHSFEEDVTGDGLHEKIDLKGELLSNKSNYYRSIWLSITSPFANEWKIPFKSGYEPRVHFIDLNQDQINDIFFASKHSEHDDIFQYDLYSLTNGTIKRIPLPKQQLTQGEYKPNFKISLKLSPYRKATMIDINRYKTDYINVGIYDNKGKPLTNQKPPISPLVHLEPVIISETKGYGLKSVHYLKKFDNINNLGRVETLWYYKNNSWIILQTKWYEKG